MRLAFLRYKFFGTKTSTYVDMNNSPMLQAIGVDDFFHAWLIDEHQRSARVLKKQ
jgi:hypothetical protein